MCEQSCHKELAKNEMGRINYCAECMRFSLVYTNAYFSFNKVELIHFKKALGSFHERDFCFEIMGQSRAILQSKYSNMGFSVSKYDIKMINKLIDEALLMIELYEVLDY